MPTLGIEPRISPFLRRAAHDSAVPMRGPTDPSTHSQTKQNIPPIPAKNEVRLLRLHRRHAALHQRHHHPGVWPLGTCAANHVVFCPHSAKPARNAATTHHILDDIITSCRWPPRRTCNRSCTSRTTYVATDLGCVLATASSHSVVFSPRVVARCRRARSGPSGSATASSWPARPSSPRTRCA